MDYFGEMSAWAMLKAGGPMMIPILFCSFFALGVFIEKFVYFSSIRTDILKLKKQTFELIKNNDVKTAIDLCDSNPSPVAKILKAGITQFGHPREDVEAMMKDASLFEIPKMEQRLTTLATISHVTPLLGLLGTVTGMMAVFQTIQARTASLTPVTAGDLAGGIGEALITTVAGLMVAIPAYVAYNYFVNTVNYFVSEMERGSAELVHFLNDLTQTKMSKG